MDDAEYPIVREAYNTFERTVVASVVVGRSTRHGL